MPLAINKMPVRAFICIAPVPSVVCQSVNSSAYSHYARCHIMHARVLFCIFHVPCKCERNPKLMRSYGCCVVTSRVCGLPVWLSVSSLLFRCTYHFVVYVCGVSHNFESDVYVRQMLLIANKSPHTPHTLTPKQSITANIIHLPQPCSTGWSHPTIWYSFRFHLAPVHSCSVILYCRCVVVACCTLACDQVASDE